MVSHYKLVRDLIPFIIEESGSKCEYITLDKGSYICALEDKLNEEVTELIYSKNDDEYIEELADIIEVIRALCDAKGIEEDALEEVRADKERKRGGFWERFFLLTVEEN